MSRSTAPESVYFIEHGTVDINWTDPAYGLTVTHSFEVAPVEKN